MILLINIDLSFFINPKDEIIPKLTINIKTITHNEHIVVLGNSLAKKHEKITDNKLTIPIRHTTVLR